MTDQSTPTVAQLRERAAELDIEGRSSMDRAALVQAIGEAELSDAQRVEAEEAARAEQAAKDAAAAAASPSPSPTVPAPSSSDDDQPKPMIDTGRGPLSQVARERVENAHVRTFGDNTEEN
jgi:hypothetical protein